MTPTRRPIESRSGRVTESSAESSTGSIKGPPTSGGRASSWTAEGGRGVWITALVVAAVLWGFIELADGVVDGRTDALDRSLLLSLREPGDAADPIGPQWVEEMARDITALGSVVVLSLFTLIVLTFLSLKRQWRAGAFLLISVLGASAASFLLKKLFSRPRPDLVAHEVWTGTSSFPSSHSMMSAATFLTLALLLARFQRSRRLRTYVVGVGVVVAIAVGVTRVYLGVHWPSDVLAGFSLGIAWALACSGTARALQRRRLIEPPR